ncbi:hypothetical protein HC928_22190 [bacterium]|nr:hypothetical protein [bacterium]
MSRSIRLVFAHSAFALLLLGIISLLPADSVMAQDVRTVLIRVEPVAGAVVPGGESESGDAEGLPAPQTEEFVLQLEIDEPVGLILPDTSRVTVYTDFAADVDVYSIRSDVSPGGYRVIHDVMALSTSLELNIFNDRFTAEFMGWGLNASEFQATRPFSVLGGRQLTYNEGQPGSRRTDRYNGSDADSLPVSDYFTHEMIVIGAAGTTRNVDQNGAPASPPVDIRGVASFHLLSSNINVQIVGLNESTVDLRFPALQGQNYIALSNWSVTLLIRTNINGNLIETANLNSLPRSALLQVIQVQLPNNSDVFGLMADSATHIYLAGGINNAYTTQQVITLQFNQQAGLRMFDSVGDNAEVTPLVDGQGDFVAGTLYTTRGEYYAPFDSAARMAEVNANGQLVITVSGTRVIVDPWLVELSSE